MKPKLIVAFLTCLVVFPYFPLLSKSEELSNQETKQQEINVIPTVSEFSYKLQQYSGFNFIADFLAESIIKILMKLKTRAKDVSVDLKIYSGWDLLRKKAKSLEIKAQDLFIKDVPVEYFELVTNDPVYFKKNEKQKNQVVFPVNIFTELIINLEDVISILNKLPKWKNVLQEVDLPLPPFGETKISLSDLEITVNENGLFHASSAITSLVSPTSEPVKLIFSGNLILRENKIVVDDLQSEAEDIFTKNSDIERSFSEFLEDLINPVFDFNKYQRRGIKIDNVNLSFEANKLILKANIKLLPKK